MHCLSFPFADRGMLRPAPPIPARVNKPVAAHRGFTLISLLSYLTPKGKANRFGTSDKPRGKSNVGFLYCSGDLAA